MFSFFKRKKNLSMKRVEEDTSNKSEILKFFNVRNTLREGDEGEEVKNIQKMLYSILKVYPTLPNVNVDGKYDNITRKAVEAFQSFMGLKESGIVDDTTMERLKLIYNNKDKIKGIEKIEF